MSACYHQIHDVADSAHNLGSFILSDGTHSNIEIELSSLLAFDHDDVASSLLMHHELQTFSIQLQDGSDTDTLRKLGRASVGAILTALIQAEAADNSWTDPSSIAVAFDNDTGLYVVGYLPGTGVDIGLVFTTDNGARYLGWESLFPLASVSGEISYTAPYHPWFIVKPTLPAVSNPSADRESGPVGSYGIGDDGISGGGLARPGAPVERDYTQQWEPIAKVEPLSAVQAHPYTHRQLQRDARQGLPYVVSDGGFGNPYAEIFTLRPEGTAWAPERSSFNVNSRWNINYPSYVRGALVPDDV